MRFFKYHAIGNDYLVLDAADRDAGMSPELARRLCDRRRGIGSDGVLLGHIDAAAQIFRLEIWNPDGSTAEKSGNGLRIFARHLWDRGLIDGPVEIALPHETARVEVMSGGHRVRAAMGRATFWSDEIPATGPRREIVDETMIFGERPMRATALSLGNPHCVFFLDEISREAAESIGPIVEADPRFPNRINVQLARVVARDRVAIEIWERGAGYTLSSGSSSAAVAAAARKLGLTDSHVVISMPGGELDVRVEDDFSIDVIGDVAAVAHGVVSPELLTRA